MLDWDRIKLVVFDVDGTIYHQRPLRIRMARDILIHSIRMRELKVALVLRAYRRLRERISDAEVTEFENMLIAQTAASTGYSPGEVQVIVQNWIEEKPLGYVSQFRYAGILELVAGMRRKGKLIGVLSDYPAHLKLAALDFVADYVLSATDDRVQALKPHPRGLETMIALANVEAISTVFIGDRVDRDGAAARRAGAYALIRSSKPIDGWQTFATYGDAVFLRMLQDEE